MDQLATVCTHDFSFGYCPVGCVRLRFVEDDLAVRKEFLYELGHKRRALIDRVDVVSLIQAYQQVHFAEKYPWGIPHNLITPHKILRIISHE